jgi:hypothetical protein
VLIGLIGGGRPEMLYAETGTGVAFAMHDARPELGHYIEIYEDSERLRGFYDMVRSAAANWDGSDPIHTRWTRSDLISERLISWCDQLRGIAGCSQC